MFQRRSLLRFGTAILRHLSLRIGQEFRVEDFTLENDIAAYFLGICQDFKHFGFAVSVLILNEDGTKIVRLLRKEACNCRFTPADAHGRISKILYANWRKSISSRSDIEDNFTLCLYNVSALAVLPPHATKYLFRRAGENAFSYSEYFTS